MLAWYLSNIDSIKFELQERKVFIQDLKALCVSVNTMYNVSAIVFVLNILFVKHQIDWQSLLDKSWCSMNYHARQASEKEGVR